MTKNEDYRESVFQLIDEERERQIKLGKSDNNPWIIWLTILNDYLGRVANTLWKMVYEVEERTIDDLLEDTIKLLAIGVAFCEHIILESPAIEPEEDSGVLFLEDGKPEKS